VQVYNSLPHASRHPSARAGIGRDAAEQQALQKHDAYIRNLRDNRELVQDGPLLDGSGRVTVVEVGNAEEARAIAAADPA
jgi:uncharacterized protein YciI